MTCSRFCFGLFLLSNWGHSSLAKESSRYFSYAWRWTYEYYKVHQWLSTSEVGVPLVCRTPCIMVGRLSSRYNWFLVSNSLLCFQRVTRKRLYPHTKVLVHKNEEILKVGDHSLRTNSHLVNYWGCEIADNELILSNAKKQHMKQIGLTDSQAHSAHWCSCWKVIWVHWGNGPTPYTNANWSIVPADQRSASINLFHTNGSAWFLLRANWKQRKVNWEPSMMLPVLLNGSVEKLSLTESIWPQRTS